MKLTLVTGGARSGKSRWAVERARALGAADVTFIATASAEDEEMSVRIAQHRSERPAAWITIEETTQVPEAIAKSTTEVVVLDCLTLWISNLVLTREPKRLEDALRVAGDAVQDLIDILNEKDGILIAVTNEVGLGVVPSTRLGRWYRDALGAANARLAEMAETVVLLISGLAVQLKGGVGRA